VALGPTLVDCELNCVPGLHNVAIGLLQYQFTFPPFTPERQQSLFDTRHIAGLSIYPGRLGSAPGFNGSVAGEE
jgi:hypothetical protein